MKAINLKSFTLPDITSHYIERKSYSVFLHWNQSALFTNRKKMLAFISEVNRLLTNDLYELVDLYSELHNEYWQLWFYMDKNVPVYSKARDLCEYHLGSVPQLLNLIIERSSGPNGNFLTVNAFVKIIYSLKKTSSLLDEIRIDRRNPVESRKIRLIQRRLEAINTNLKNLVSQAIKNSDSEGKT